MTADAVIEQSRQSERQVLGRGLQLIFRQLRRAPRPFALGLAGTTIYAVMTIVSAYVIGYATDLGPPPGYREVVRARHELKVVDAARSRLDLPGAEDLWTEAYVLELPAEPTGEPPWDLVLETGGGPHLRQVTVETLSAGANVRAEGKLVHRGSVFRIAGNAAVSDRLALPSLPGPRPPPKRSSDPDRCWSCGTTASPNRASSRLAGRPSRRPRS